jgi:quercetin dioxygenase-like cupin family protein
MTIVAAGFGNKETVRKDDMRKYLVTLLTFIALGVPYLAAAGDYALGVDASLILKTSTTTGHYPVKYLDTESPEITVMKVEIKPGTETGWHSHTVPLYAYVLEGDLTVEAKGGKTYQFTAGDAIVEFVNVPHNGKNLGTLPVVLIVFYTGEIGRPNTVMMPSEQ